jgi:hypothetical protein
MGKPFFTRLRPASVVPAISSPIELASDLLSRGCHVPRPFAFGAALAALAASATVSAAPSTRLVYARGPGAEICPDEAALRRAVATRVGYDPFFPWAPLTVVVEMARDRGPVRARVVVIDRAGIERGVQSLQGVGTGCDDLVESTALAIAVALDALPTAPETSESSPPPEPEPPSSPAPVPSPAPSPIVPTPSRAAKDALNPTSPAPQPPRRNGVSLWAAPGARISAGAWNAASFGPDLLVELRRGRLGLGAEGRYDVASIGVGESAQANVQRATATLLPCAHFSWLVLCGVAAFGELWARGDVATPRTASQAYAAFGGRTGADLAISPKLHVLGTLDVVGVATGTVIQVDSGSPSTTSRPVEASGGIALLVPIL